MEKDHEGISASHAASELSPTSDIVDFDGPDDPTIARNWKPCRKWYLITTLAAMTFLT